MTDLPPPHRPAGRRPPGNDPERGLRRLSEQTRGQRRPARRAAAEPARLGLARRRRWPHRLLVSANVVVALALVSVAGAYGYVHWRFSQIKTTSVPSLRDAGGGRPFTLLVVGSDSRAALSGPDNAQFGSATTTAGQRSDTIILVRVVPATRQLSILSIPRDLWGPIPGHGSNRINAAFDSGPDLLVQTIQQDLGIPVNHFAEVNFDTFRDITDAVGGVKYYFPTPAKDAYSLLNIPAAGCYTLTGDQALAFVRSRHYEYYEHGSWHYEAASDLARIQRQQSFVKKMIKKAESKYTNPIAINDVIAAVTKNLTVDKGFSAGLMISLAEDFRSVNATGIPNQTLPTYPFTTSGGAEVLGLQQPQAQQMIDAFNHLGTAPASPAPKATGTTTTLAPSGISIEVANGTGTNGQAAVVAGDLARLGYHATVTTATPGYDVTTTRVDYAPDAEAAARQVAARIGGGATLVEDGALTPTPYNLEVVTGRSYTGITGAGAPAGGASGTAGPGTASTATTSPPAPTTTTYVLPGTPPGQAPPANC